MPLDGLSSAATTWAAAALETQGYVIQSMVIDAVNTGEGQQLAGLLYLLGIIVAVGMIAIGGEYKFGRYLLVGPPLFFFLTQVRSQTDGTEWRFADRIYDKSKVLEVLRDLPSTDTIKVSTFFHTWNLLVSDIVQSLIEALNLTERGNDINFIGKVERYMNYLMRMGEIDPKLAFFLEVALINRCVDYYMMLRDLESPYIDDVTKQAIRQRLEQRVREPAINFDQEDHIDLRRWAREGYGIELSGTYTCDQLWETAITMMRPHIESLLDLLEAKGRPEELDVERIREMLQHKFRVEVEHASGKIRVLNPELVRIVNELIARRLFNHMMMRAPALHGFDTNRFGATFRLGGEQQVAETARAIGELQSTEMWQFKGDLLVGALALPYFQGLCLFLLASSFPFFAMMLVVPGRHGAILLWMGLWVWVKSWDFGMAVVMMIDNMLYAMFPRGPGVTNEVLAQPGRAWHAVLTIDPTFSANTYYNIIATCLFAVPVVTAVFVKKGGGELMDAVTNGMTRYSTNVAGSLANYYRSLQSQSKAARAHKYVMEQLQRRAWDMVTNDPEVNRLVRDHLVATVGADAAQQFFSGGGQGPRALQVVNTALGAQATQRERALAMRMRAVLQMTAYEASYHPEVRRLAGEAILHKYNSHDFGRAFPNAALHNAMLADTYFPHGQLRAGVGRNLTGWSNGQ